MEKEDMYEHNGLFYDSKREYKIEEANPYEPFPHWDEDGDEMQAREDAKYYAFCEGAQWADKHPVNEWHDLRKNPEDLPEGTVLVKLKDGDYAVAWLDGWGGTPLWGCASIENGIEYMKIAEVIAWCALPNFE